MRDCFINTDDFLLSDMKNYYPITEVKECCVCRRTISTKSGLPSNLWLSQPKLIIGLCTALCIQTRPIKLIRYYTGDVGHILQSPIRETF